ncbi:hypothetical protein [Desulforhabdus amnigena]|jgi:hypothetical protein|uniref:Uncharacterized protein n=1 Tax=Desulforhabdus amnigena TaxID=40218 RepID=A0A9W6FW76_9BACT|nr:hypothetical protein [Desulforhabdus amnigena]NLJ26791.1 hypothetical protein [Deltaproteobacteria bacterium]GLI35948.1 hypothetical protein DAMNIGENAA_33810 [Desulforhabdus amnigena]
MNPTTRWASLAAGCILLLYGMKMLYQKGDWVLVVISALIVAFSALGIIKERNKKE